MSINEVSELLLETENIILEKIKRDNSQKIEYLKIENIWNHLKLLGTICGKN